MKNQIIMRGYSGLQAFFPTTSVNVQEIEPTQTVSVAAGSDVVADRGRLLTQRNARHARRLAH